MSTDPNVPPVEPELPGTLDRTADEPPLVAPVQKSPSPDNALKFTRAGAL
jgi:hypothetical protein